MMDIKDLSNSDLISMFKDQVNASSHRRESTYEVSVKQFEEEIDRRMNGAITGLDSLDVTEMRNKLMDQ